MTGPRQGRRQGRPHGPAGGDGWIYGWHAVRAALANPERQCRPLLATEDAARRLALPPGSALQVEIVDRARLAQILPGDAVHQGVALLADPLAAPGLDEVLFGADDRSVLLVLDQVSDPHNVGAV